MPYSTSRVSSYRQPGFSLRYQSTSSILSSPRFVPSKRLLSCVLYVSSFMDKDLFYQELSKVGLSLHEVYTVYIKVRYHKDKFFMAANQFGLDYNSLDAFDILYDVVLMRLEDYFIDYKLSNADINYILISFRLLDSKIFSDLMVDKNQFNSISVREQRDVVQAISIPAFTDLGKSLRKLIVLV